MTKKRIATVTVIAAIIVLTKAAFFERSKTQNIETQERVVTQISQNKPLNQRSTEMKNVEITVLSTNAEWQTTTTVPEDIPCEIITYTETEPALSASESFAYEQTTLLPQPPQPQHGDINEKGEMYINGFGWIAFEGTNSCEYSPDMYTNGNKIGCFG